MEVISKPIDDLIPYINNPKKHPDTQVDKIASSIKNYGFTVPVVVDGQNEIIMGHGRLQAARKLGLAEVPCIVRDDLSEAQVKALRIADNKVSESEWDIELLLLELEEIEDFTGFALDEIQDLSGDDKEIIEDEVPEPPDEPVTKSGDLWILGRHRLLCGDSTKAEDVERLMDGKKADMVFTSPPYNANAKTGEGDVFQSKKSVAMYQGVFDDNLPSDEYIGVAKKALENCFSVTDGYIFWNVSYNANSRFEYIRQIEDKLEYLIEQVCWKKTSAIPLKGSMRRAWEPVYVFSVKGNVLDGDAVVSNVWDISNTHSQYKNHKACFPVGLPTKGIEAVKKKNGIVVDVFGGTGTTLIAAEQLNRICYMMEIDPKYCDVIVERWENLTGQKAELSG